MPSPSKNKGNSFERVTADFLTELYGERFIRAPGSGAYVGGKNSHRKTFLHEGQIRNFKGDIVPGLSFPKFNAECKSYKAFPFHQLFTGEIKILETWLDQCMDVADPGDFNIIFMKFNRKGAFVAVEAKEIFSVERFFIYKSKRHGNWYIMEHNLFWQLNAETVKNICK